MLKKWKSKRPIRNDPATFRNVRGLIRPLVSSFIRSRLLIHSLVMSADSICLLYSLHTNVTILFCQLGEWHEEKENPCDFMYPSHIKSDYLKRDNAPIPYRYWTSTITKLYGFFFLKFNFFPTFRTLIGLAFSIPTAASSQMVLSQQKHRFGKWLSCKVKRCINILI